MRSVRSLLIAGTATLAMATQLAGQAPRPQAASESIQGTLADGSNYRAVKPAAWNGTIVLDLDFANNLSAPPSIIERWMIANGYAIGGISREPAAYRFHQAVDDLLEVRRLFTVKWNATPRRTLTLGNSRGGFVSRVAMERKPDIFKGAVLSAGGGAGEVGTFNAKLDALWTLKVLTGAPLTLVGYASQEDALAENGRVTALVKELRATPAGRARLALAAAFEQFPRWTGGDVAPAATDYEAQLDQIADQFSFANPAQVRRGVEVVAGGNFSWNHGVDYAALLARSGMSDLVGAIYAKSGVDLQADLRLLAQAPRISAEAAAVAAAETMTSYSGAIAGPVIVVDNIGDPVDADAYKRAYERTVARAGRAELLRTTWVRSARHANQSALEKLAGFVKLIERLNTGAWSDTTPEAMMTAAAAVDAQSDLDLGPARFMVHSPPEMLRPWDSSHWGTYPATLSRTGSR
jgi:pimeloyl-ACP methyl ester carboxylesterase